VMRCSEPSLMRCGKGCVTRTCAGGWAAGRLGGWAAGRLGGWAAGRLGGWAAGRLGGDEFIAYLAHTDQPAARQIAEGLLGLIRETSAALGPGMQTTASIGIATDYTSTSDPGAMLAAADSAMYRAKREGGAV